MTDAKLRGGVQALQRVRDLSVRAASSLQPQERAGIAIEILSIRDELVGIANTRNQGQGLFAGTATGDAVAQVAGVWTYAGDASRVQRRIGEGEVVAVTQPGDEVFGFADGDDVFTLLETIAAQVQAGDATAVSGSIADVDAAMGRMLDGLAEVGAVGSRIEKTLAANEDQQLSLRGQLSEIEDVDLAEATMEMQLQQVAYQATLSAMARALQPSLADFLR
jgi:flagellar hook-associated protein 3 FlgL